MDSLPYSMISTDITKPIQLFSDSQGSLLPKIAGIFQLVITPSGVLVSTLQVTVEEYIMS